MTATDPRQTTPLARLSAFAGEHEAHVSISFVPDTDGQWFIGVVFDGGPTPGAIAAHADPEQAIVDVLRQAGW